MNAELALRIGLGAVTLIFGIDQLRNWEPWQAYVPRWLKWTQFPSVTAFWRSHAMLNVFLGIALFSGLYTQWVSLVLMVWLAAITFVTFFTDKQTSTRDFGLTMAALALWFLTR
ncbi:DoxX family membrane protein [Candidatus Woesearchaeota archaeon]|nr:DoxX family membrane protein [Candidatus Woesearchaeota archaeon]